MRDLTCAFCFLARDCARRLPSTLAWIEQAGSEFSYWRAFGYENDSRDETAKILSEWAERQPKAATCTEAAGRRPWGMVRSAQRGTDMADYRNRCRRLMLNGMPDADVVVVLDADLKRIDMDGLGDTMSRWGDFDVMASNGLRCDNGTWVQADAWAWRSETWDPLDFQQVKHHTPLADEAPQRLLSAFGGMAVYRGDAYRAAEYGGGDCEHVVLHRRLYEVGYDRLYLNPAQVAIYP